MAGVIVVYTILIVIFLIISSLILRHTFKFSYLSPRFTVVVWVFGILALSIVILSLWFLFTLGPGSSSPSGDFNGNVEPNHRVNSNGLNF